MKRFFYILTRRCLLLVVFLQFLFMPCIKAGTVTFSSGSYIIPMDTTYQNDGMWPAFGLIYNLLQNGIPVNWGIIQPKTSYSEVDFNVPSGIDLRTSAAIPPNYGYTGGPYIIDSAHATAANALITAWWAGHSNQPTVHQATSNFTAEVDIVLNRAPVIAIEDVNQNIAESYMTAAGIPASVGSPPYAYGWSVISEGTASTPSTIAGGGLFQSGNVCQQRIFDVYVTPHNSGFSYSLTSPTNTGTITYSQLDNFVYLGGGWIALCYSLQTNEDSMSDLTSNGNAAVKALFRTTPATQGGLLLQQAAQPYQTPSPGSGAFCPNAAFPVFPTQNTGSRWVPDLTNLGLPIIQGILPTVTPELTFGQVSSWTSPPTDQPIGVTPTNYPNYWSATRRISYFDTDSAAEPISNPGTTERYDSILDGVYHNGTGAGKVSFFGGHQYNVTLPYTVNSDAPYLRAFYNALLLNGNGAVKLQIDVPSTICLGKNATLNLVNTGSSTATIDSSIVITLAPDFSYSGTNVPFPPPDMQAGQTLTWFMPTIPSIPAGATAISINVLTSLATPLGSNQVANLGVQYSDPFGYTYTADACTGTTVASVTKASITGANPQTLCALTTTSATLSGNTPNAGLGETGLWTQASGPGGAVITSPTSPTTTVTGLTGTPGSNVYVFDWTISSSGGFCTSTASATVNVFQTPAQPSVISGPTTVCFGSSSTYSVTNDPIATSYTWTLPSGWTGTSTTHSITATAGSSGTISVVANNNSCTSAPRTLAITVDNIPAQPGSISGPTSVCSGTAYVYSIAAVPGANSYTWTLPSGWTGSSTTTSITATPTGAATSGSITVTANNNACSSIPQSLPVTVSITPAQPGAINGPATVCSGTTNTYSVTPVAGATGYTWTLPSGWSGISTTNSINATASTTSGNITVTANNGSCASVPQTLAVTVTSTPAQPGAISGPTTVCTEATNTYSITPVPGATSYTWALPSGWTGTSTTNSINATSPPGAVSGNISVVANNGASCFSSPQTLAVTVTTTPAQPGAISGPSAVCSGTIYVYSVAAVPGATSYTWTLPTGWTGASSTNSISATPTNSAVGGNITVKATNGSCSSTPQTLAVTVTITPVQPGSISGPTTVCSGVSYVYSISPVPGATNYTWTLPSGWAGASTTNSITATSSTTSGSISVTANNDTTCTSSPQTLAVNVTTTPGNAGPITGSATPCTGVPTTYSIAPVANATSYLWNLPSGWTGTSTTNSITVTPSATSGTISVTSFNGSCSSTPASLAVTPTQSPGDAGSISGSMTVCSGVPTTYSIAPVVNATSYVWGLPSGWTGSSTTNSITVTPSTTSGTINVTPLNGSCEGLPALLSVTVTTTPNNAGPISGSATPCSGVATTYSIAPVANATSYSWSLPSGWTGSSTTNSITVTPSTTSGTVNVTPLNGSCASTPATLAVTVTQTPGNAGSISGSTTPCSNISTTYSIAPAANAISYTWTLPSGWTGSSTTNSITVVPSMTSGTITVTPHNGSCTGAPASLAVTVTATPVIGPISGPAEVCFGSTNVYFTTQVPGAIYTWTLPPGWMIVGSSTEYAITATASGLSGNITVAASSSNGLCSSSTQTQAVTVNPLPTVTITPPAITINKGTSTTLTASGASTYMWSPGALTGASITVSPASTTTYTVTGTDANGCVNTSSATVTVVNAVIVANPDSGSVPDGASGGTAVANVLANDKLNGSTPTLATVQLTPTSPFSPYITLNPSGSVTVQPGTPAGVYTIGYTICEIVNPTNCSSTTVQTTVGAPPIVANPDSGTVDNGANGGIAIANVLANDTLNGVTPTLSNVNLTLTGAPNPFITLNSNGSVSAAPGTPAGVYVIGYKICEVINPTNCSSTTATVTVNPPPIVANPDSGTVPNGSNGGIAISNVLVNDTLNGVTPTTANVTITPSAPFNPNVIINSNGEVDVPPGTPAGVYTAGYRICEIVNPTNCSSTTVHVTVGAAPIVANPDSGSANGATGGTAIPNVLANDTLNGVEATLATVTLTPSGPTSPYVMLNPDGSVSLAPGTPAGVYTIGYTICQIINPTNCSSTTVQVTATASSIVANADFGNVPNGTTGGVAVANVLANDTLNGMVPTLSTVTLTPTGPTSPFVTLNPDGSVSVAPNTPAGVYTIGYEICEILNPTNCSSTIVTTTVGAALIVANPDSGSVPDGATGGIAVSNVLANDTLNGVTPTLADVNLSATSPFSPFVILNLNGSVSVLPGTPSGVYEIGYMICQKLNPTNCSSSMVQVAVGAPPIVANPDSGTVSDGTAGGVAVPNVLANDTINGMPATLLNVNLAVVGTPSPYLVLDPNTGSVSVLPGTPAGVYTLQYQICDKLNPTNCATATVTVTVMVTPQPPVNPEACQVKQQFIGGTDIIDVISWNPPTTGPAVVSYRIYANAALTDLIGEVPNMINSCDTLTFSVHHRKKWQINIYYIVSVDALGQISTPVSVSI